ncbi:MAG: hypothetical protein ABGZ23_16310 [Fuerstiella sp.]
MNVVDAERVEHVQPTFLCFPHNDFRRIVACVEQSLVPGTRLSNAFASWFEHVALVVRGVTARSITPEQSVDMAPLQRSEQVLDPLVQVAARVLAHGMTVTIEDHPVSLGCLRFLGGICSRTDNRCGKDKGKYFREFFDDLHQLGLDPGGHGWQEI